jgi:hypothetical protein
MLSNPSKIPFNYSKLSLDVILHIVILFTILSWFFMLFISKITYSYINNKLSKIISDNLTNVLYKSDNRNEPVMPGSYITNIITDTINNNVSDTMIDFIKNQINDQINSNPVINNLNTINGSLITDLLQSSNTEIKKQIQIKINNINSQISVIINKTIADFPYTYYVNIFKEQDTFGQSVNKNLFTNIKLFNGLLVIFLIFYICISLVSGSLTPGDVSHIFIENIITFIFVGGIEYWFFMNVAFKFVPAPPSLIFIDLFSSLKESLEKIIQ